MTRAEPQHIQTLFKRAVKYRWAAEEQAGSGHFPTAASVVEPTGALLGLSRVLLRYPRVSSAQSPSSWAQHLLTGQLERLTQNRLVWVCAFAYTRPPRIYTDCVCACVSVWCVFCPPKWSGWDGIHRWSWEWTVLPCQSARTNWAGRPHGHRRGLR